MAAGQLEDVMTAFYEGKFDILLATTIVESGLDIPTAKHRQGLALRRGEQGIGAGLGAPDPAAELVELGEPGQMAAGQLEDVMTAFYEGKFDILLATTIVESGLAVRVLPSGVVNRA
jgi:transcription-repair coupling factor (superfamily II helicase)